MTYKHRNPQDIALADGHEERRGLSPKMPEVNFGPKTEGAGICAWCFRVANAITYRAWSAIFGTYYEGSGICSECRKELYESLWCKDEITDFLDEQYSEYRRIMDEWPPGEESQYQPEPEGGDWRRIADPPSDASPEWEVEQDGYVTVFPEGTHQVL